MSYCPCCEAEIGDCDRCGNLAVKANMVYCSDCGNQYCKECVDDKGVCDGCGKLIGVKVCNSCNKEKDFDKMYKCQYCCEYYCKKCAKSMNFQCECENNIVPVGEI